MGQPLILAVLHMTPHICGTRPARQDVVLLGAEIGFVQRYQDCTLQFGFISQTNVSVAFWRVPILFYQ